MRTDGRGWKRLGLFAGLALLIGLCPWPAAAGEPQDLRIPWQPGRMQQFSDTSPEGELVLKVFRPDSTLPAPFVVFMHGCGGLKVDDVKHWADFFLERGVGVAMVDSFSTRNVSETCGEGAQWVRRRADDADSTIAWLRSQPFVRADRIALMGQSQGGSAVLVAGNRRRKATPVSWGSWRCTRAAPSGRPTSSSTPSPS